MAKIYTLTELKQLEKNTTTNDFFNLPSKLSKKLYQTHFTQKYNDFL